MEPQIRFCTSADGTRIAYALLGDGSAEPVVSVNSWVWNIDMIMAHQAQRAQLESLTDGRRVVTFDRRGTGASQRDAADFSLEANIADLEAVVEQLDVPRVHLVGYGDGAAITIAYSAKHPENVARLVLFFPIARGAGRPESAVRLIRENWSWARRIFATTTFPNGPVELQRWISSAMRQSMSPEVAVKLFVQLAELDITEQLGHVRAPTLVIGLRQDHSQVDPMLRNVAAMIPDARLLIFRGDLAAALGSDELTLAMNEFINGKVQSAEEIQSAAVSSDSYGGVSVILFADIVDSTAITERVGDAAFRGKARDLDVSLRAIIRDNSGTAIEGKLLGDGVLATFTSAAKAIEAALACGRAGDEAGLPLHLGLHAGDVIREEGNVFGGAVNIASRISGLSAPGEVLVSQTVRDLARTSAGVTFEDRGEQPLKGVSEPVRVWAVREA